ncbi:MAG: CRISPR-associated helicase Cas3' [Candidatus Nezhaarchaeales archaeon]
MLNSTGLADYWNVVEAVVKSRGRAPRKYCYFEEVWSSLRNGAKLVFLQAPTGAGKTEAALTPFFENLIRGERRWHSLIYVLPTRSLTSNMFYRLCKALNACRQSFGEPRAVVVDYDYGGFIPFKAFMEGDVTVTTYDTLVYTFYGFRSYGHHFLLSAGKIAGSLVILDEVQLLQDTQWYSLTLLPYHVANLAVFGATVVVMSATLPKVLVEGVEKALKPFEGYQGVKYSHASIEADPNKDVVGRGRLNVSVKEGRLLDFTLDVAKNHEKPMLLIFNTVERAVEAYQRLVKNGYDNVVLLHSRLVSSVRKGREEIFEKNMVDGDLIVTATQVVEAGVDYDFKTVATEVSPVDSLIQRLGRCARKSDGTALVFNDLEQAKHVYPQAVMEATVKTIDENSLAESVRSVLTASKLVNPVYSWDIVEKLRGEVRSEVWWRALSFIKNFSERRIFTSRDLIDDKALNLLRLGVEVKCLLLPEEIYRKVLENVQSTKGDKGFAEFPLDQAIGLLEQNTLSLSVEKLHKNLEIPALKHRVNDEEFYLSLSVTGSKSRAARLTSGLEIVKHKSLFEAITRQGRGLVNPLIINPLHYVIEKDYHLGLVKPYG